MKRLTVFLFFLLPLMAVTLPACAPPDDGPQAVRAAPRAERMVTLYNWEDYLGPETVSRFEEETGIRVDLVEFDDEESIIAALQSGDARADLAVVGNFAASELYKARLLADINYAAIPNFRNVPERYRNMPFDPDQRFSVPYLVGRLGIVVNTRLIPEKCDSWEILWDARYAGRLAMLSNSLDVIETAARMLGFPVATVDPDELQAIKNALEQQKPLLAGYLDPETIARGMEEGTLWAAQVYSGDGMALAAEHPDLAYVSPREGSLPWIDVLVIPELGPHKQEAHAFINFLHRPEIMADIATYLCYVPTNAAALRLLRAHPQDDPDACFVQDVPDEDEFFPSTGASEAMAHRIRMWNELRAAD